MTAIASSEASFQVAHSQKLQKRYRDAYRQARLVVTIGSIIKVIGIAFALMVVGLVALAAHSGNSEIGGMSNPFQSRTSEARTSGSAIAATLPALLPALAGLLVGGTIYFFGLMISAQGQILKAGIDSAVNGSPFLTNEAKARVMSLD